MTFSKLGTDAELVQWLNPKTGIEELISVAKSNPRTRKEELVYLPKSSRLAGLYIIGIQGTGKTGLIENLIIQDIKQQIGVCILDPHGELIDNIIARLPVEAEDKVILLDIMDEDYPFGLNLFTCSNPKSAKAVQKVVDKVKHIFEKLLGVSTDTPLILEYLLNCTYTLIANPGYTMADIPLLLADKNCRQHLIANVTDSDVLLFWQHYEQMKPSEQIEQISSLRRRIREFLQPLTRPIVGQNTTTIDLQNIMNEGKILLVKLSPQLDYVSSLIGSLLIALLLNAAYARPTDKRKQFHLYADEFERFATEDFAELLEQARKFGIATTIAHQNRGQLNSANSKLETDLKDRTRSVDNLVVFKINSRDADDLAGEFDCSPLPGEPEPKPVMRPVMKTMQVTVWNPPEAEAKYKATVEKLQQLQQYAHVLLGFFTTADVDKGRAVEIRWTHSPMSTYFEYPIGWIGVLEAQRDGYYEVGDPYYAIEMEHHRPSQPTTLVNKQWVYDEKQTLFSEFKLTLKCQPAWNHEKVRAYLNAHVYQSFDVISPSYRMEWYEKSYSLEEAQKAKVYSADSTVRIRLKQPRVLTYRFPADLPSQWEAYLEEQIERIRKNRPDIPEESNIAIQAHKRFLEDLRQVLTPLKARALYQFDPTGTSNPSENEYLRDDGTEKAHWKKAPFPEIKTWIDQKIAELLKQGHALQDERDDLIKCKSVEFIEVETDRYEPVYEHRFSGYGEERIPLQHLVAGPDVPTSEVKNRLANQLSQLPKFTARVKIAMEEKTPDGQTRTWVEEHLVKTLEPEKGIYGKALQERIARIQARNRRDGYMRERTAIEAEITQRQQRCSGSSPAQSQPQQGYARQVKLQGKCPNCGASNRPGSKFCNQCGTQL
jgi:hypothetical protein